jgi:hypothetical protein
MKYESTATGSEPTAFVRLGSAMNRTGELCARIARLSDHLLGSRPESDGSARAGVAPDGLLGAMDSETHHLNEALASAESDLARIERAVGV